ncbi:hypothetical protein [Methanosarcina sp. KYL-1]|uniref:hypothetical protein n=1 Tax=Methanosarcina sp. KYL-1 TaxID=2602068 RepID=UPI002101441A
MPVFEEDGKSPGEAIPVEDPLKSRVLYGELEGGGNARYYSFEMEKGERILLGLIVPVKPGNRVFAPDLVLMGPGLADEGKVPKTLEIPEGNGVKMLPGKLPESATYEGFSPSAFYSLARLDLEAPESGTYYAAVASPARDVNYGIVLGYRESFSLKEWVLVPLGQIRTYRWEGQSLPFILAPLGLTLAAGVLAVLRKKEKGSMFTPAQWAGAFASLFFLGTGLSFLVQMLVSLNRSAYSPEVFITLFLGFSHLALGVAAMGLSLKGSGYGENGTKKRLYFFGLAFTGLLLWAGWLIGPLLAFEAGLLPWGRKKWS